MHGPPLTVVVMAASAGGIEALTTVLRDLPRDFPAPIVIVQHRSPDHESLLVKILGRRTQLAVTEALPGGNLKPGTVYVAPADQHLTVTDARRFAYTDGHRIRHVRSSANPLFASAARAFGRRAIGLVLTGRNGDGTDGVQAIKGCGGIVIAQNEATSRFFDMPRSAISTGAVDYVLPLEEIAPTLQRLVAGAAHHPKASKRRHTS